MAKTVCLINMKGGVGKTTLAFNLSWYSAWRANLKVLAVDLDPQSNLSQYFMGDLNYLEYIRNGNKTIFDIFEQYSNPFNNSSISSNQVIYPIRQWDDGSLIDLIPSRLELAWTLQNPFGKDHLLSQFLENVNHLYDLIIIDCAPTESTLTTAAYKASDYVIVPVKPEYLATVGLPLLERSLRVYRSKFNDDRLKMSGIIFNGKVRNNTPPTQIDACIEVRKIASTYNWYVFDNEAYYSASYPRGSKDGKPIFLTDYVRDYVKDEFLEIGEDFLNQIGVDHYN